MKDHEIAQFVNGLTTIAREYGQTQQLRERISQLVHDALKVPQPPISMLMAPECVGKLCSCVPGICNAVRERPDEAVQVTVKFPLDPYIRTSRVTSKAREKTPTFAKQLLSGG